MEAHRLLRELEQVAGKLGIRVRTEQLKTRHASPGGFFVLRGERVVLLNSRVSESERMILLADILAPLVTEELTVSDEVSDLLQSRQPAEEVREPPTPPAGPGLRRAAPRG
jgi:hypothetical protein